LLEAADNICLQEKGASYDVGQWKMKLAGLTYSACLQVEIRPGVLHRVSLDSPRKVASEPSQQQQQPFKRRPHSAAAVAAGSTPPPAASSSRADSKAKQQEQQQVAAVKPYQQHTLDFNPALASLENLMRQQLKSKAAVHTKEKTVLLAAFAKVQAAVHTRHAALHSNNSRLQQHADCSTQVHGSRNDQPNEGAWPQHCN
jgi:hypothetical protein